MACLIGITIDHTELVAVAECAPDPCVGDGCGLPQIPVGTADDDAGSARSIDAYVGVGRGQAADRIPVRPTVGGQVAHPGTTVHTAGSDHSGCSVTGDARPG